jgi:hypothetical protein
VLAASDPDGQHTQGTLAKSLRALGWAGLELRLRITPARLASRLPAGAPLAQVTLEGSPPTSSAAVATRSLADPSLGWRLAHLL